MAIDVAAVLGIQVDSSQVTRAANENTRLAQTAGTAARGVDAMSASASRASATLTGAALAMQRLNAAAGGANAISSMSGLLGRFGPHALVIGVLADAALSFFKVFKDNAPSAETILKEQDRLIGQVAKSYDTATGAAKNFYEQTKDVVELLLKQQIIEQEQRVTDATRKPLAAMVSGDFGAKINALAPGAVPESMRSNQLRGEFEAFRDAAVKLQESFKAGIPDVRTFQDEVAKIAKNRPELEATAVALVKAFEPGRTEQHQLDKLVASLQGITKGADSLTERQRAITGTAAEAAKEAEKEAKRLAQAWDRQLLSVSRHTAAINADAVPLGKATNAMEKLRAAEQAKQHAGNDNASQRAREAA